MAKTKRNRVFREVTPKGDLAAQFQTPMEVARYMETLIPYGAKKILEPTPGQGNLVKAMYEHRPPAYDIFSPKNFFTMRERRFDCVVMNPPFSQKYVFGLPKGFEESGMRVGYHILLECMKMSDNIIALVPWFTLTDSDRRLKQLTDFGLKAVTALPRKTFNYSRIQTCVIELDYGFKGQRTFKTFHY